MCVGVQMALSWHEAAAAAGLAELELLSGPGLALLAAGLAISLALLVYLTTGITTRRRAYGPEPGTTGQQQKSQEPGAAAAAAATAAAAENGAKNEPKRRNRRRASDKLQRNGVTVEVQEETRVEAVRVEEAAAQSPESAELKTDKAKKNKKKAKAVGKEAKSSTTVERKDSEEAGSWETKVSNREKRQQKRKDKGASDGSSSPGGVEPADGEEPGIAVEEPQSTVTSPPPKTTPTTRKRGNNNTSAPTAQRKDMSPAAKLTPAFRPQVSPAWEEVLAINGSDWRTLGVPLPTPESWHGARPSEHQEPEPGPEPRAWPQDMEGSWTIVDGSHIPVSFPALSAGSEVQAMPDLSWSSSPALVEEDEWGGMSSGAAADPTSDWSAPCEEWGNYTGQPQEGAVPPQMHTETQESETEKDRDESAATSGNGKSKKKKKKKKKVEDSGNPAQVEVEVGVTKGQETTQNISPKGMEQEIVVPPAPPRPVPRPAEADTKSKIMTPPAQKKVDDTWESPKQVKKKKARRET